MPLFNYECDFCGGIIKRILTVDESQKEVFCKTCQSVLRRIHKPASSQVKEVLDNGIMTRKIERYSDAEELFYDRAHKKSE